MRRRVWSQAVGSFLALPGALLAWAAGADGRWAGVTAAVGVWLVIWGGFIEGEG